MYDYSSYLKDIHIVAKVFSFFFLIASILFLKSPLILLLFALFLLFFFRSSLILFLESCFFVLTFAFPIFSIFMKVILILYLFSIFIQSIDFHDIRTFLENFFYPIRSGKIYYFILAGCYFFKFFGKYLKEYVVLKNAYGKKGTLSFWKSAIVESFLKSKKSISSVMNTYQYRFYHFFHRRTYVENTKITSLDLKYTLIFVIIFFFTFVYGR